MWTDITRPQYERTGFPYASDATDAEWVLVAPLMPLPKALGRPRTADLRDVFDAILYMAATGCQWWMLPNDFPPVSTVRRRGGCKRVLGTRSPMFLPQGPSPRWSLNSLYRR